MNVSAFAAFAAPHRQHGLLLDTNLLLILIAGSVEPGLIQVFQHTKEYSIVDYQLLLHFSRCFDRLVTTPNILTEVSNLGYKLPKGRRDAFFDVLKKMIPEWSEHYKASGEIVQEPAFVELGLTDAGLFRLKTLKCLILTADGRLRYWLGASDVPCLSFDELWATVT